MMAIPKWMKMTVTRDASSRLVLHFEVGLDVMNTCPGEICSRVASSDTLIKGRTKFTRTQDFRNFIA